MPYDIITIGSATRDVFLVSKEVKLIPSGKFLTGVGECVALGTKIDVDEIVMTTGGGATNAAATFANLGFDTGIISRIGKDCAGAEVIDALNGHGVDTALMRIVKGGTTGYSTLLTEPKSGERTVLVYRGVSSTFGEADIPWKQMRSDWLYVTSLAGNTTLVKKLVSTFGKKSKIVWNPGMADVKKGWRMLKPIALELFMLNLNREEASVLFGFDALAPGGRNKLKTLFPPTCTLLITDGPRGATAYLDGQTWSIAGSKVKAVSRTGAGDAFGSGVVAGLMKGIDIERAMNVGLKNAESVIQHYGAKAGILKRWPKI